MCSAACATGSGGRFESPTDAEPCDLPARTSRDVARPLGARAAPWPAARALPALDVENAFGAVAGRAHLRTRAARDPDGSGAGDGDCLRRRHPRRRGGWRLRPAEESPAAGVLEPL